MPKAAIKQKIGNETRELDLGIAEVDAKAQMALGVAVEAGEKTNAAKATADGAASRANTAQSAANAAQSTADLANAIATQASTDAATAQATADSAVNKASAAQTTANQALAGLPVAASAAPKAHGTASVGSSAKYAREDHVHPSNNTDTHWTTHLYVGAANGSVNAATANGGTYLIILDNNTVRDRKLIKGGGSVSVTSDTNGNITITGTDTNTTYGAATQSTNGLMTAADKKKLDDIAAGATNTAAPANMTGASTTAAGKAGYAPAPAAGAANRYLRSDGTWQVPPDTNTTYVAATQSANGLMTAADKKKLDGIAAGAQVNPTLASLGGVAKAGDTMTGALVLNTNTGMALRLDDAQKTLGANPSGSNRTKSLGFCDKNGNVMAQLAHRLNTDGTSYLILELGQNTTATSKTYCRVSLQISSDGTYQIVSMPTPAGTDNSTAAATTAWTRSRISAATGKGATTFSLNNAEIMTLMLEDGSQTEACAWSEDMITPVMLESALDALKDMISSSIFAGFYYEIGGVEYYFTYDLYDQQNLADAAILGLRNKPAYVFARDNGATMRALELTPQEAIELHAHAAIVHKRGLMNQGLELSRNIHDCLNSSQLESLLREAGLLESYREYLMTKSMAELDVDSIIQLDETESNQIIIEEA